MQGGWELELQVSLLNTQQLKMNTTNIEEAYELKLKELDLLQLCVYISSRLSHFVDVCGDKDV